MCNHEDAALECDHIRNVIIMWPRAIIVTPTTHIYMILHGDVVSSVETDVYTCYDTSHKENH